MDFVDVLLALLYLITLFYTVFWLTTLLLDEKNVKKFRKKSSITVAVPAYNEEKTIKKTLDSIKNLDYPKELIEIILINDGSKDKTQEIAENYIKQNQKLNIRLITQQNSGKWVALNRALESAKGEFFACLDADSMVERDALKKMLPSFADEKVGAVLPLLKVKTPTNFLQKLQWYEYLVNMFYKKLLSGLNCIHVTPGPFAIYRKELIKQIGCFRSGHQTEDLEMAMRLQKNDYKIIQVLDAVVYTCPPSDIKTLYTQRLRWNRGSVLNIWDYKRMIFDKRYGDFGYFQMPMVLAAGFMSLGIILILLYKTVLKPAYYAFHNFSLVNFDLITYLRNMSIDFVLLDINYYRLVIILTMLFTSLLVFYIAHRYTNEKMLKQGLFSLISFLVFYYLFLGFVWGGLTLNLIFHKREKW